jgi:peptidoglycan/LPS O-acetylase OafA/YrhL
MNDLFAERIYGIPWLALTGAALAVALFYAFVPAPETAEGIRWFVLRWFHTIAWVFLALAAMVRAKVTRAPVEFAAPLAATGGLIYVVLMVTSLTGA